MPIKVKNEDGTESEAFTSEELEARAEERAKKIADEQVAAERERFNEEREDLVEAKAEAEEAQKKTEEELKKLQDKDYNFEQLRKKNKITPEQEDEAKKNAEVLKSLQDKMAEIEKQPIEAARSSFMDSNFAPDDKEQRDLFDYFYKKLSVGTKTMDEVNKALVAAFNATTGGQRQPSNTGRMARTSVNDNYDGSQEGRESEASKEFGAMFGLSAEDKKRFSDTMKSGKVSLFSNNPPRK